MSAQVLADTESVCTICMERLAAQRVAVDDNIYLVKTCPQHGRFSTIIWRGLASYTRWGAATHAKVPAPVCETPVARGCPFDCGLCPEHRQHSCCVLLEVTQRCNLRCPVCFAAAGAQHADPDLAEIRQWLTLLQAHGSALNIQLSGGEPTVRNDLPQIVALVRSMGFDFVQINTNGIRLAKDAAYAKRLADAGLDCVFLQFDGLSDASYRQIRGIDLVARKQAAIERCRDLGLGVVLVPTLVPGVNIEEIGAIIDFAAQNTPCVRAVHFQPISYFGRYPSAPRDSDRITLPEVMGEIERQTAGRVLASSFNPGSAENAYCSFNGSFYVDAAQQIHPTQSRASCGCGAPPKAADARDAVKHARQVVAAQWVRPAQPSPSTCCPGVSVVSFDTFLAERRRSLSISGMAFQDAWTLDLERLRDCFIHVVSPDQRVIPFCAYNLSAASGQTLYRETCASIARQEITS